MRSVIESFEYHARIDFHKEFDQFGKDFADFLDKILVLDPEMRYYF